MSASRIWLFVDNFGACKMPFGSLKVIDFLGNNFCYCFLWMPWATAKWLNFVLATTLCRKLNTNLYLWPGNEACLIARRSGFQRSALGFKSYSLAVNISDNSVPQQWAVQHFALVVESTNDNPPQPGTKNITANTYNGVFDNVPLGNVYVDDPDDWDLADLTFSFADPPAKPYFT